MKLFCRSLTHSLSSLVIGYPLAKLVTVTVAVDYHVLLKTCWMVFEGKGGGGLEVGDVVKLT